MCFKFIKVQENEFCLTMCFKYFQSHKYLLTLLALRVLRSASFLPKFVSPSLVGVAIAATKRTAKMIAKVFMLGCGLLFTKKLNDKI